MKTAVLETLREEKLTEIQEPTRNVEKPRDKEQEIGNENQGNNQSYLNAVGPKVTTEGPQRRDNLTVACIFPIAAITNYYNLVA